MTDGMPSHEFLVSIAAFGIVVIGAITVVVTNVFSKTKKDEK